MSGIIERIKEKREARDALKRQVREGYPDAGFLKRWRRRKAEPFVSEVKVELSRELFAMFLDNVALKNKIEKLEEKASHDRFGAGTDYALGMHLSRAISSHFRAGTSLTIVYIDLDSFKELNDTKGHAEGDKQLLNFVDILNGSLKRKSDGVYRPGGDEFVLILENTTKEAAKELLYLIRERIAANQLPVTFTNSGPLELSTRSGETVKDALARYTAIYEEAKRELERKTGVKIMNAAGPHKAVGKDADDMQALADVLVMAADMGMLIKKHEKKEKRYAAS